MEIICIKLMGSSTKNIPSPKSHILDSNGVWYSPVWSEGPKNHLNLKSLVSKIVVWDLGGRCTKDLQGRRHGTSRSDAGVSTGVAPQTSRGSDMRLRGAVQKFRGVAILSYCFLQFEHCVLRQSGLTESRLKLF